MQLIERVWDPADHLHTCDAHATQATAPAHGDGKVAAASGSGDGQQLPTPGGGDGGTAMDVDEGTTAAAS